MEVEWSSGTGKQWRLIEVKEGNVNWRIREIIEETPELTPLQKAEEILNTLGPHALKQAERMAKQQIRMADLDQILETNRGMDFKTKEKIDLSREVVIVKDYCAEIHKVVQGANDRGIAAETVDHCLHLLAVRSELMPDKFSVSHSIYHMANPEEACKLLEEDQWATEVQAVAAMKAPVVDLIDLTMRTRCGYPIFLCFPQTDNRLLDLVEDRIRVFAQFDIEAFMRLAAEKGLKMSPIVGREAQGLKKISNEIPGCPGAWGIRVQKADGDPQQLLVGFFSRPFYYFTRPSELLKLAWSLPPEGDSNLRDSVRSPVSTC